MVRFKVLFLQFTVFIWIFSVSPVFPQQIEYLQKEDVTRVMNQIFERHVNHKQMTQEILKNSLRLYLEQFDPYRTYLLQNEADPFLNPSESEIERYLENYKKHNFNTFRKLDDLMAKAIKRQQNIRKSLMSHPGPLFQGRVGAGNGASFPRARYAENVEGLKQRVREDIMDFIDYQKDRFGAKAVNERRHHVLNRYENLKEDWEAGYLYVDNEGRILPDKMREHQFTLHVLKALSRSLDSHTSVINESEAYNMRNRLLKGHPGVGLNFEDRLEGIAVEKIQPDTPAEKVAKIKPGDLLLAVNGTPVTQYSFNRVLRMLEGEEGSAVSLTFKRPQAGESYSVDLKREMIMSESNRVDVQSVPFEDGVIGKIALHSFYKNSNGISSEKDVRNAISKLKKEGRLKGLVLDLRSNSGGYLSEAVKVAGLFITNGVIVISKYHDGEKHYYRDVDGKTYFDGPLVVLISRATASAAEIVAQALQDYGVAVIVGDDRSYGKGSIQSQTVTGDEGSAYFKVTVGKYYTVSGKTPQVKGVLADVVVPGEYAYYEDFGEKKSKNSLLPDRIEPAYVDNLSDIKPEAKPWFLRYYLPTLQPKKTSWQKMIPDLIARSGERLQLAAGHAVSSEEQVREAVNVVQDMIKLHSKLNKDHVGAYE